MAEEKQLTVAELLARNAAERAKRGEKTEGTDGQAPRRRRRRRSLEEGGVSVAELTGNINKVDATPAQSKHSNVDIDETAPVIPAPKKPAESADKTTAQPEAKPAAKPEAKSEAKPAPKAESKAAPKAEKSKPAPQASGAAAAKPESKPAASASPAKDNTAVIKRVDAPAADKPAAKAPEKSETKAEAKPAGKPAAAGAAGAAGAAAAAGAKSDSAKADSKPVSAQDEDDTGVIPVVQEDAAPSKADRKAEKKAAKAERKAEKKAQKQAEKERAAQAPVAGTAAQADGKELETTSDAELDRVEDEDESKINFTAVILLALVGIVLGAVVFKGFEILWERFDRTLVAILAVGVTAAMVGIIHALRTTTDKLSMALAAVVGLVLTFGPLLIL